MDAAWALLDSFKTSYATWAIVFAIVTVFELLNPRENHPLRSRLIGIGYWLILTFASVVVAQLTSRLWPAIGIRPLLGEVQLPEVLGGAVAVAILGSLLGATAHDFFFYWYHRVQHRWLWRWHAVHHSVNNLSAATSYHHVSEVLVSVFLLQLPATLLTPEIGPTLPLLNFILWCHIVWIHSPTKVTLGPLRAFFVDNRFHRIHHSLEERHFDKNFGAFTSLWDRLFGTAYLPAKEEWPAVGLAEIAEPKNFRDWLTLPGRLSKLQGETPRILQPAPETT